MKVESEEFKVKAGDLADKVKDLIHEGNVRRIIIKDGDGHTIMEIPVTAGVVVALVAPVVTALGAVAALAAEWSIQIERVGAGEEEKE